MSSPSRNKRGSSRRKGDEFQDLIALRILLELYSTEADFRVFLEYEKIEAVDDVVVFTGQDIRAIQIKYAIDPLAVYVTDDFTNENSRTYFGKYAEGWRQAKAMHPGLQVTAELLSNRSRDSGLQRIIGSNGNFNPEFIVGTLRKEAGVFRKQLKTACAFEGDDADKQFMEFLTAFQFRLGQRPRDELRQHLQGEVLDHKMGISDRAVFLQLMNLVEQHAVELHEPITRTHLDLIFQAAQRRFLLPQVFPVDARHFVEVTAFGKALQNMIDVTEGGYIVVTGLPGSGKSTSLSEFFDSLEDDARFEVCRYFCFVRPNEDTGRLRLEAEALRVNLLSELHRQFRGSLDRQHDYSENRFIEVLSELGSTLVSENRKLVILLDGLDHAERDPLVRESVLRALPNALPPGIIIVAGTQELKHWHPLALHEGRDQRHVPIPLFTPGETRTFLVQKHALDLDEGWIERIHAKSQGLPLYLRYVAEWLLDHDGDPATLEEMPEGGDGDIRKYYERLWSIFDQAGMSHGRHLCGVLAALKFPVGENEVEEFQKEIPRVDLHAALRVVAHLLRKEENQVSIFHDSFRVFTSGKLDQSTRQSIARDILAKLKSEHGSSRWFSHIFRYALDAGDEAYVLAEVNRTFVDFALQHCRPASEIMAAIGIAAEAAVHLQDLVSLARLGSLHFRSQDRLEQFSYGMLAKVQLALARVGEVLGFCCRSQEQRWLVNESVADQVMVWCAEMGHMELGRQLYEIYLDTHDSAPSAAVLGIYSSRPARVLQWLATFNSQREMLERIDLFLPGYAPSLAEFLESQFHYGPVNEWQRFKKIKRLFPNALVRHLLLRLVAKHGTKHELAAELEDYLAATPPQNNLEVAGYAAMAGFPASRVRELAGPVILPPREVAAHPAREEMEKDMDRFEWSAIILGYENDSAAIESATAHLGRAKTMYAGFLRFLLRAGVCLGRTAADTVSSDEKYATAVAALDELATAGDEEQPGEMEVLHACRPMLPEAIFRLTRHVAIHLPEKLDAWRDRLLALRDCEMWTSHWGISETTVDYTFELRLWERLRAVPGIGSRLLPILRSCATTYAEAAALKSGSRSEHFLWLAAIAARCGWRNEAEKWREKGTACSLTYGYHKDITLDYLVDVLKLLNHHEPEHSLRRAAAILEMVRWMQAATDNRGTKHFEQSVFQAVLQVSREGAFALVRYFREHTARWKMLDCLEEFCVAAKTGDPVVLWALKDVFKPHFHESGRHSRQVIRATQALRDLGQHVEGSESKAWHQRYTAFIRTNLDPVRWPSDVWPEVAAAEMRERAEMRDPYASPTSLPQSEFILGGIPTPRPEIERLLIESIGSFCRTAEQLRSENSHFHDEALIGTALEALVVKSTSAESVRRLWDVTRTAGKRVEAGSLQALAHRLFDFGESNAGFECLLLAYQRSNDYYPGSHNGQVYLNELCERDRERTVDFLVQRCEVELITSDGGFDLPRMIARYYEATGNAVSLGRVFGDYLTHCEELFAHMPKDERYAWLHDYREDGRNEEAEVINFLIDLMGEPEIDQAKRLVRVLVDVAKARSELVCRIASERILSTESLLRERLETLLETLAFVCPEALALHLERLLPLFNKPNFRLRMTLLRTMRTVAAAVPLPVSVSTSMTEAERLYSPLIAYPSRRFFQSEPSLNFVRFLERALLFDLQRKIKGACELLRIPISVVFSFLERTLRECNWSEADETERLKSDWYENVRDHRVIWIVPRFDTQVSELVQQFVHEAVENGRYDGKVITALENVFLGGDPAFMGRLPQVKPGDIPALNINDGGAWIKEIQEPANLAVNSLSSDGWTTVHEERRLSQTKGSHSVFVSHLSVRSLLVAPGLTNRPGALPPAGTWPGAIPALHPEECLTLAQAQDRLAAAARSSASDRGDLLPLISAHPNSTVFHGFRTLAFLHPIWLGLYHLVFNGTEITANGRCIARIERWEEGYEEEVYSRELLSAGMRLVIQNEWLNKLLTERERALVIHTEESRKWHPDFWKKEPTAESAQGSYSCFVHKL